MIRPDELGLTTLQKWVNLYDRIHKARIDKQHLYLDDEEVHLLYEYLDDPSALPTLPEARRALVEEK